MTQQDTGQSNPTPQQGVPSWTQGLMNSVMGSIARRFPADWNDGEGGIDWSVPVGTPVTALADGQIVGAGYFCNAAKQFFLPSDSGACDHGVVTTRVTNSDGSQTDLYYQHILLNPAIQLCNQGIASCGGQIVHKGDVIGTISNFGMLEVGVNVGNSKNPPPYPNGWGGIWGADPSPGPHVDPEAYLRALISGQNTTASLLGTGLGGSMFGLPDISGWLSSLQPLWDWLKNPARLIKMVAGLMLVGIALYMLIVPEAQQQISSFVKKNPEVLAA